MKSVDELAKIREEAKKLTGIRENQDGIKVVIGMGTCGIAAGARETLLAFMDEIAKRNLEQVTVTQTGCIGFCEQEPIVEVNRPGQEKVTYGKVSPERARLIVANHLVNGKVAGDFVVFTS